MSKEYTRITTKIASGVIGLAGLAGLVLSAPQSACAPMTSRSTYQRTVHTTSEIKAETYAIQFIPDPAKPEEAFYLTPDRVDERIADHLILRMLDYNKARAKGLKERNKRKGTEEERALITAWKLAKRRINEGRRKQEKSGKHPIAVEFTSGGTRFALDGYVGCLEKECYAESFHDGAAVSSELIPRVTPSEWVVPDHFQFDYKLGFARGTFVQGDELVRQALNTEPYAVLTALENSYTLFKGSLAPKKKKKKAEMKPKPSEKKSEEHKRPEEPKEKPKEEPKQEQKPVQPKKEPTKNKEPRKTQGGVTK